MGGGRRWSIRNLASFSFQKNIILFFSLPVLTIKDAAVKVGLAHTVKSRAATVRRECKAKAWEANGIVGLDSILKHIHVLAIQSSITLVAIYP